MVRLRHGVRTGQYYTALSGHTGPRHVSNVYIQALRLIRGDLRYGNNVESDVRMGKAAWLYCCSLTSTTHSLCVSAHVSQSHIPCVPLPHLQFHLDVLPHVGQPVEVFGCCLHLTAVTAVQQEPLEETHVTLLLFHAVTYLWCWCGIVSSTSPCSSETPGGGSWRYKTPESCGHPSTNHYGC